jgi:transcription initiation factor TFIIA large subunit
VLINCVQEWQKKLSALKVAHLPWDPPPVPAIKEQSAAPSNTKASQNLSNSAARINTPPPTQPPAPAIKTENNGTPAYPAQPTPPVSQNAPNQQYQVPSFQQGQPMTARDRAAMNLHQTYGQRAGAQIAQLQSGGQSRVPIPSAAPTGTYIKQEDPNGYDGTQDFTAPVSAAQTDGAGDSREEWNTEYSVRKAYTAVHGAEGDQLIRAHVQAQQQAVEGGGLLTTLHDRVIPNNSTAKQLRALGSARVGPGLVDGSSLNRAQGDATGDDDDEDDEDAINSDLDDPDDLAAAEENGENTDQVMLCTYDKVQRVKNKWKCTLKDGVLRVDGTE